MNNTVTLRSHANALGALLQRERERWGFCPDCGLNMDHPLVALYHQTNGKCPEVEKYKNPRLY
jgi:hypothetical protein